MLVEMYRKLLKIYRNCNGLRLTDIVTGDETRIHYYESPRKTDIKMWLKLCYSKTMRQYNKIIIHNFLK